MRWLRKRECHNHEWTYSRRTGTGWGIATCRTCGETDLY